MPAGQYTYFVTDLRPDLHDGQITIIDELPFIDVNFTSRLNAAGRFHGSVVVTDPGVAARSPLTLCEPGRQGVLVDRDGVLIWAGMITHSSRSPRDWKLVVEAEEMFSYFERRVIATTHAYTNADQLFIVSDLLNYAQGIPGGNIGVIVPAAPTSGVTRTITYAQADYKPIGQAIRDLASTDRGFDFTIRPIYQQRVPTLQLVLGYPRLGAIAGATGALFETGSNIVGYDWQRDGTNEANYVYGLGQGSGTTMISSRNANPALIDQGFPLLEASIRFKDVATQPILDALTIARTKAWSQPLDLPTIEVRGDLDPVLGSYQVGDDVQIRITDAFTPQGWSGWLRITALSVTPPSGIRPETVTLTLATPPTF